MIERIGFNAEGKIVEDLNDAVTVIESEYDEDGEIIRETVLFAENSPGVLPAI